MLTQDKKLITFTVITLLIILIMVGCVAWMIRYLTEGLNLALTYRGSGDGKIQGFNFEGLKNIGIKEINDILNATSMSTSTTPTSTNSTSTSATSTDH
ncbi:MAG: hypothetical protein WC297_01525 [Candidatus Paceibacterota bacterium]|jgi:hypothetical protein